MEEKNTGEISENEEKNTEEILENEEKDTEEISENIDEKDAEESDRVEGEKKKPIRKKSGKIKKSFTSNRFKSGVYSSAVTVVVIALVVILNLIMNRLDLSTDLTSDGLFTLSKDTKSVLSSIQDDITIYYMVAKGDEQDYINRVLKKYGKASKHVKVVKKDPVVYPGFAKKYVDEDVADNDVIVVNEDSGAAKYVSSEDMYYTNDMSYYGYGSETFLDAEGQITSAIQNVSSDEVKKIYMVTGHSEQQLTDTLISSFDKMNVDVESISLVTETSVPDDCTLLVLDGPQKDLRDSEKNLISEYLKKGGDAIVMPMYVDQDMPNLNEILEKYGIGVKKGIIYEGAGHYESYINWIVPTLNTESELLSKFEDGDYVIVGSAQSLTEVGKSKDDRTITDLLTTSNQSFLKVDPSSGTMEKEKGDMDGPFVVAKYVEDTSGEDTTKLTVIATNEVQDILMQNVASAMMNSDSDVETVSVAAKNLSYSSTTMGVTTQILWAVVLIILIPVGLLLWGFGIWFVRRKK